MSVIEVSINGNCHSLTQLHNHIAGYFSWITTHIRFIIKNTRVCFFVCHFCWRFYEAGSTIAMHSSPHKNLSFGHDLTKSRHVQVTLLPSYVLLCGDLLCDAYDACDDLCVFCDASSGHCPRGISFCDQIPSSHTHFWSPGSVYTKLIYMEAFSTVHCNNSALRKRMDPYLYQNWRLNFR